MKRITVCIGSFGFSFLICALLYSLAHLAEKSIFLSVIIPTILLGTAGHFSSSVEDRTEITETYLQWVGWSAIVGFVLGIFAVFSV